jgi:predicted nucleic acid-binding protein
MILADTNILARMTAPSDPQCAIARRAVHLLFGRREQIIIVPQNLFEFWAVDTRKLGPPPTGQNGLGLKPKQTSQWLNYFQRRFKLLHDTEELVGLWHDLVKNLGITGMRSHDIRLVAAMQNHGMTTLLTFNFDHFRNCPITVVDPASL